MSSDKTFFLLLFSTFFFPAVKISRERRAENHRETLTFRRDNTIFQKHTSGRHGNAVHKVGEDAMRSYPSYPERHTLCLDGAWEFAWLGDEVDVNTVVPSMEVYDEIAAVPGCFDTAGERIGRRGVGLYRRTFHFPAGQSRLTFGGVGLYARFWFDGREIGRSQIPYAVTEFEFPVEEGVHEVVVAVDNRFDEENVPLFKPYADFYGFGGIYRSVVMQQLPKLAIDRLRVVTREFETGLIRVELTLRGLSPKVLKFSYGFDGEEMTPAEARVVDNQIAFEIEVPGFRLWSPEHPDLHLIAVRIKDDFVVERFGIRTVEAKGRTILLNGEPLRLLGVNRHESHPEFGPVQPTQLMVDDLKYARELKANFIRGAHYQQNPEFLELCDQMGFLVWEESFGWGQPETDAENPETVELFCRASAIMAKSSLNNPSVIIYGFLNESCSDTQAGKEMYRRIIQAIRAEDDSRLITYASNRFERDLCFDLADLVSINPYPGWISDCDDWTRNNLEAVEPAIRRWAEHFSAGPAADKPLLISEIGACGIYGIRSRERAQWSEEYQSDYFEAAVDAVLANPRYCGVTLWQMIDCKSFVNSGQIRCKPRGFNCAGLLDEYRRPKLAFDTVKRLFRYYSEPDTNA